MPIVERFQRGIRSYNPDTGVYALDSTLVSLHYPPAPDSAEHSIPIDFTPFHYTADGGDLWVVTAAGWHYGLGRPAGKSTDGWAAFAGRQNINNRFLTRLAAVVLYHKPTNTFIQSPLNSPNYDRSNLSNEVRPFTFPGYPTETFNAGLLATWDNIWQTANGGTIRLEIHANGDRLKQNIVVDSLARIALINWVQSELAARPGVQPADVYLGLVFSADWSNIPILRNYLTDEIIDLGNSFDASVPLALRDGLNRALGYMPIDIVYGFDANGEQVSWPMYRRLYRSGTNNFILAGLSITDLNQVLNQIPAESDFIFDPTINQDIATGYDDAYQLGGGTLYNNQTITYVRCSTNTTDNNWRAGGLRFQCAGLPNGALVGTTYISGDVISGYDNPQCYVYTEAADNPSNFSDNPYVWNTTYRPRSSASVDWHDTGIGSGVQNSVSLTTIAQEAVNQEDWVAGNHMVFLFIPDSGKTDQLRWWAYEHGGTVESLHLEYTSNIDITVSVASAEVDAQAGAVAPGAVSPDMANAETEISGLSITVDVPASASVVVQNAETQISALTTSVVPGAVAPAMSNAALEVNALSAVIAPGAVIAAMLNAETEIVGYQATVAPGAAAAAVNNAETEMTAYQSAVAPGVIAAVVNNVETEINALSGGVIPGAAAAAMSNSEVEATVYQSVIEPGAAAVSLLNAETEINAYQSAVLPGVAAVVMSNAETEINALVSSVGAGAIGVDAAAAGLETTGYTISIDAPITISAQLADLVMVSPAITPVGGAMSVPVTAAQTEVDPRTITVAVGASQIVVSNAAVEMAGLPITVVPGATAVSLLAAITEIAALSGSVVIGATSVAVQNAALESTPPSPTIIPGSISVTVQDGGLEVAGYAITVPVNVQVATQPGALEAAPYTITPSASTQIAMLAALLVSAAPQIAPIGGSTSVTVSAALTEITALSSYVYSVSGQVIAYGLGTAGIAGDIETQVLTVYNVTMTVGIAGDIEADAAPAYNAVLTVGTAGDMETD